MMSMKLKSRKLIKKRFEINVVSTTWISAMTEEIDSMQQYRTYHLVILSKGKNLVGSKWLFKVKKYANGDVTY